MKKAIDVISIVCIACALFAMFSLSSFEAQIPASQEAEQAEKNALAAFPLGQTRLVDLEIDEETRDKLTRRELHDQFRDWLMFTVLSDTDLSAEEVSQSIFDIQIIRYGYTQPVANFEYGDMHSCCIGDGKVLALIPSGVSEDERTDYLAHIADEHRKNLGEIPTFLLVFEYEVSLDEEFATLTRRNRLDAKELYTEKAGYYEAEINDLEVLKRFLGQVDDITYAHIDGGYLTLGGRKIKSRSYRGIRTEDVAAIWQAEQKIHAELTRFRNRWQRKLDALNAAWRGTYDFGQPRINQEILNRIREQSQEILRRFEPKQEFLRRFAPEANIPGQVPWVAPKDSYDPPLRVSSQSQYDKEYQKLNSAMQEDRYKLRLVDGSGFSLDPAYDYGGLAGFFEKIEPSLLSWAESDTPAIETLDIDEARSGLASKNVVPYLKLVEKIEALLKKELEELEDKPEEPQSASLEPNGKVIRLVGLMRIAELMKRAEGLFYKFQAARYDGDLQGTEVGMDLFYTDLLAKLWAIDYLGNLPDQFISDFKAMPEVPVSPIYIEEMNELRYTRLWFGPQDKGFQVAEGNRTLLFARNATRIYAASSNPLEPGVEKTANAQSAAFLGWWNDHYEEVARYEPEYERLNEIMKWSLLLSWLNEAGKGEILGGLAAIQVDRSNWFPEWVCRHPQLRFAKWDQLGFHERGYMGTSTEALPILCSDPYILAGVERSIAGGVSLAPKTLFKARQGISGKISTLIRRSNLNYATSGGRKLSTLSGTEYNFTTLARNRMSIVARAKEATKLRGRYSELANLNFERVVSRTSRGLGIKASTGRIEIGRLGVTKTQQGFRIAWRSRDIDMGQSLAIRLSRSPNPDVMLVNDRAVAAIVKLPKEHNYFIKMHGSDHWLKMSPEGKPSVGIAKGWQSRVADPRNGIRNMQLAWVDDTVVQNQMGKQGLVVMEPVQGTGKSIIRHEPIRGPPTKVGKALEIKADSFTIKGRVDPTTGRVNLPLEELPGNLRKDPSGLQRLIRASDLQQIRGIAKTDVPTVRITVSENRIAADDFIRNLGRGDYGNAAKHLVNNPRVIKKGLEQHLLDGLKRCDRLLADGRPVKAIHHLDDMINNYGSRPEFTLRRGIAQIDRGKVQNLPEILKESSHEPLRNRLRFFDEINERLRRTGLNPTKQNNLRRATEFTDWADLRARNMVPDGEIVPLVEGDKLALHYGLANSPKGQPVKLADAGRLARSKAPIYVQDSPGLNNLDWHASIEPSLQQVIRGDLGTVVRLPRGDIAHFRPDVVYSPGNVTRFRLVGKIPVPPGIYRPYRTGEDDDDDDKEAYFVISKIDTSR